jgi:hypothetical protein
MIDVAFRKIKGGQASTGPHHINPLHTTMTRQRSRYKAQRDEYSFNGAATDLSRKGAMICGLSAGASGFNGAATDLSRKETGLK